MTKHNEATDRHHGGPGSSRQNADKPEPAAEKHPHPGEPTNGRQSGSSSGGGERDLHHTHDPKTKR
ncbi:hypothetical protein JHL17_21845 [Azospirillum sp. YIM B02556]|uniref:Uncharacterized protein n=1 Tax=Azospirillum endophyticum TaxID=2800326 RepID=A0ABS1F9E3_9PROT|nr:hypothetical protein [Azospirillum endophyticum]MBK1840054.1 hypothetical protein [Azospirillum endophyticum]